MFLPDNDILINLAAIDIIDESFAAVGVTLEETYLINTAKYVFGIKKRKRAEQRFGAATTDRLLDLIQRTNEINWQHNGDLTCLSNVAGIDPGEAIILSATNGRDGFLLATGDRRFVKALVENPACDHISNRIAGKVICLEQIILQTIAANGFDFVRRQVRASSTCDSSLRGCQKTHVTEIQ